MITQAMTQVEKDMAVEAMYAEHYSDDAYDDRFYEHDWEQCAMYDDGNTDGD